MAELRWGAATHEGQMRTQNEDHLLAVDGLFVVADGMGGHLAGEVASEIAVARLLADLQPATGDDNDADQTEGDEGDDRRGLPDLDRLVASISTANQEIFDNAQDDPEHAGMGTTITALAVVSDPHDDEAFAVANVGDSRIYVMRHQRLRQVSVDHSFVQELVAEGAISRDEARYHPRRNIVTRALGIEPFVRIDSWRMPIIRGDRFVLCSDGLSDELPDESIAEVLTQFADTPQAAADALVEAANLSGGRDNITVVVVDVLAGDDPPDPTLEFDLAPLWRDDDDTAETPTISEIVADPPDDPEAATATAGGETDSDPTPLYDGAVDPDVTVPAADLPRKRSGRFVRFLLGVGVAAVLIFGIALGAAWARSGYFVAFNDSDQVVVYKGRKDTTFLIFNPTEEYRARYTRDQLDADSIAFVEGEPEYATLDAAVQSVATRVQPSRDTDDDDVVDSPVAPVTTPPARPSPAATPTAPATPATTTSTGATTTTGP